MKATIIPILLLLALFSIPHAASPLFDKDPEIAAALEKFRVEYEPLKKRFVSDLIRNPNSDPIRTLSDVKHAFGNYGGTVALHIRLENYAAGYKEAKFTIGHILGLALILEIHNDSICSFEQTGFTALNSYFLSEILCKHRTDLSSLQSVTTAFSEALQQYREDARNLQDMIISLRSENNRLRRALEQGGIEVWP